MTTGPHLLSIFDFDECEIRAQKNQAEMASGYFLQFMLDSPKNALTLCQVHDEHALPVVAAILNMHATEDEAEEIVSLLIKRRGLMTTPEVIGNERTVEYIIVRNMLIWQYVD